jgi:hypothetical protein
MGDGPVMNRAARRRAAREDRRGGTAPSGVERSGDDAGRPSFITINFGPERRNVSCRRITETTVNPLTDTVTYSSVALEDTIHPVELAFEPPYMDKAAPGGAKGFRHMWEKLTYAFALPDPAQFPAVPTIPVDDRHALEKYVSGCRKLAGYSAIAGGGGFKMESTGGVWTTTADFPEDELNTTRRYAATYPTEVIEHYQQFIARRRAERPIDEYREPTANELTEFGEHFGRRRVELGDCVRPYGTGCTHEHAYDAASCKSTLAKPIAWSPSKPTSTGALRLLETTGGSATSSSCNSPLAI